MVFPEKQDDFDAICASVDGHADWQVLSPGRAAQALMTTPDGLPDLKADIFVQDAEQHGRKKLLLADMDSTIVTTETLDEIAAGLGKKDEVAAITAASMRGELDFTGSIDARVAMIAGLHRDVLHQTARTTQLSPGAQTLVKTMAHHGAKTVLVSGGFTFFTEPIASICGFHAHHGNTLEWDGDQLTGKVLRPVLDKPAKATLLQQYCAELGIDPLHAATIGDGANDRDMVTAAGLGVGYRPKPKLAACTPHHIWHNDLTALLFAQGFHHEEFIDVI